MKPVESCYLCGGEAPLVRAPREITMGTRKVTIDDEFYRCDRCDEEFFLGGMVDASLRRAAAKIREEDGLLVPEEIVALRKQYGLSQAELERLIGAGAKTVVRWERGTVHQNKTADTLLRILRGHPEVTAELARERGVELSAPRGAGKRGGAANGGSGRPRAA